MQLSHHLKYVSEYTNDGQKNEINSHFAHDKFGSLNSRRQLGGAQYVFKYGTNIARNHPIVGILLLVDMRVADENLQKKKLF